LESIQSLPFIFKGSLIVFEKSQFLPERVYLSPLLSGKSALFKKSQKKRLANCSSYVQIDTFFFFTLLPGKRGPLFMSPSPVQMSTDGFNTLYTTSFGSNATRTSI
jgi:hypothetical protein